METAAAASGGGGGGASSDGGGTRATGGGYRAMLTGAGRLRFATMEPPWARGLAFERPLSPEEVREIEDRWLESFHGYKPVSTSILSGPMRVERRMKRQRTTARRFDWIRRVASIFGATP